MNNQDGQLIKDITATLRGGQPQPLATGASSKTRHPGSQNLSSTSPALTQSNARAGPAVKARVGPAVKEPLSTDASSKTRYPGSQNLSSTRPALT